MSKEITVKPEFYTFNQNNSGGSFETSLGAEKDNMYGPWGISCYVIIEANDLTHALVRAEEIGLYFEDGMDCPCCGNRWSTYADDADVPSVYGQPVTDTLDEFNAIRTGVGAKGYDLYRWVEGPQGYVHYLNGDVKAVLA